MPLQSGGCGCAYPSQGRHHSMMPVLLRPALKPQEWDFYAKPMAIPVRLDEFPKTVTPDSPLCARRSGPGNPLSPNNEIITNIRGSPPSIGFRGTDPSRAQRQRTGAWGRTVRPGKSGPGESGPGVEEQRDCPNKSLHTLTPPPAPTALVIAPYSERLTSLSCLGSPYTVASTVLLSHVRGSSWLSGQSESHAKEYTGLSQGDRTDPFLSQAFDLGRVTSAGMSHIPSCMSARDEAITPSVCAAS
ncbi:hypothetical protein EYF80_017375 [Liparis tanakae]|uniref:Uncharacterized protein n=1 Tax=Liparis tanakae TaxID=230148 RepID=A0A4Z2I308_9TELE|nr:hypothetical protein EYF80_017375 [Liparis tanakae]